MFDKKKIKKKRWPRFGYREEKENFIDNLLMLLGAGLDIISSLQAIKEEVKHHRIKKFIDFLITEIDSGASLYQAFSHTGLLNRQYLVLIDLGEKSGRLLENLKVISIQQQKSRIFKSRIKSAMAYPSFVLLVAVIVGLAVAWFIMPKIAEVFSSMDVELPLITQIMILIGNFIGTYGYLVIPATLVILFLLFYFLFLFPWTKFLGQVIILRLPGIGKLIKQSEIARMGFILGTLLSAGLPIMEAIDSLADSSDFFSYKRFYKKLTIKIDEGNSLKNSFDALKISRLLFFPTVRQLIVSGEKSGNLSDVLLKIGEIYEAKLDNTAKNLSVLLEPLLLFVVWLAVLGVAVAIIMPIYSLVGTLS